MFTFYARTSLPAYLAKAIGRKKRFTLKRVDATYAHDCQSWWDSGSRDQYFYLNLSTGRTEHCPACPNPPQFGGKPCVQPMRPGFALVESGTFMGKPATPKLYVLDADVWLLGEIAEIDG